MSAINGYLTGMQLSQIYNNKTLNIFSDASMIKDYGCYSVIAVCKDSIMDSYCHPVSNTTVNNSEIKGLRAALTLALRWQNAFDHINIFSDSLISVMGIREYIYGWRYNPKDQLLYTSTKKPASNQFIFIECHQMLMELSKNPNCIIRIFHQNGHINNSYGELLKAMNTFIKTNYIHGKVDLNLIRYISTYNNYVDNYSRTTLRNTDKTKLYVDPVEFYAKQKIR